MSIDIAELITRRRRQILVHSAIYYRMNENIIPDYKYDEWSLELAELQRDYPDIAKECPYAVGFANFDGSSGYDLQYHTPEIVSKANQLLRYHRRRLNDR